MRCRREATGSSWVRRPAGGGADELVIAWGPERGPLTQVVIPGPIDPAAPAMEPTQVAIEANATRVAVAVVLDDGAGQTGLYWTFYGPWR